MLPGTVVYNIILDKRLLIALSNETLYPGVLEFVYDFIRRERDEADARGDELITEHSRVGLELNPIDGQCWGLGDEHPTKTVCHAANNISHRFLI